jgi:hypothetical protein
MHTPTLLSCGLKAVLPERMARRCLLCLRRRRHFRFDQDRIVAQIKTHTRMSKAVGSACPGISLALTAEVSLEPFGEGETSGFRNASII